MYIYAQIIWPQCFMLPENWDYILLRGEKNIFPVSVGCTVWRDTLCQTRPNWKKMVLVLFCLRLHFFIATMQGWYQLVDWLLKEMAIFSKSHRWSMSSVWGLSTLDTFFAVGYNILLQWLRIPSAAHIACKNVLYSLKMWVSLHIFVNRLMSFLKQLSDGRENSFCLI